MVFEAAIALANAGNPVQRCLFLDAVAYPRTLESAVCFPTHQTRVIALSCAASSWNKQNNMHDAYRKLETPGGVVLLLPKAGHGDPLNPRGSWFCRMMGLLGPLWCFQIINNLVDVVAACSTSEVDQYITQNFGSPEEYKLGTCVVYCKPEETSSTVLASVKQMHFA